MDENKLIYSTIIKIQEALDDVKDLFPEISKIQINKLLEKNDYNALKVLKRIQGIIINFNEENAERKLKQLVAFLGGALKKYD